MNFAIALKVSFSGRKRIFLFIESVQISSTSLDIALKVSSSEQRRVVLLMESVQISSCGFVCEREES